jgi:GT2 family glycosyltransferase
MTKVSVSVIVCTYRREETLRLTLCDILQQRHTSFEVIVVDQTPQHESETNEFLQANAGRLKLLRLDIPNLPNARNRGVWSASSEIIAFIDDDVRVGPDLLERLVAHFEDRQIAAIAPVVVDPRGREVALEEYLVRYGRTRPSRTGSLLAAPELIGACMAIRRSVIEDVGGFDARLGELHPSATGEDMDFFCRASARGHRAFVDPSLTVLHLAETQGGCGVRGDDPAAARQAQLNALVYITLKQRRALNRSRVWTWLRLARFCLRRRDIFEINIAQLWRRVEAVSEAVRYVRPFLSPDVVQLEER